MSNILKPTRFDLYHNSLNASKEWKHWKRTFENFLEECGDNAPERFCPVVNCVSSNVYEYIEVCGTYEVINTLGGLYVKRLNEIFARHQLRTRRQSPGESLDEFLQELCKLSKQCNFKMVSADIYREEQIREAFIAGIASNQIRQRLLENSSLDLKTAFDQARTLDIAQKNSDAYISNFPAPNIAAAVNSFEEIPSEVKPLDPPLCAISNQFKRKCMFCGNGAHNRKNCPASNVTCLGVVKQVISQKFVVQVILFQKGQLLHCSNQPCVLFLMAVLQILPMLLPSLISMAIN